MVNKPTTEQFREFKNNMVWRWMEEWIQDRKKDVMQKTLKCYTMEELKELKGEAKALDSVLMRVKENSKTKNEAD